VSNPHTHISQAQPLQPGVVVGTQPSQQSCGQVAQFSPAAALQTPLPHPGQVPQSTGQLVQVSPSAGWQIPFPHTTSTLQVGEQPSPGSMLPSSHSSPTSTTPLPHVTGQAPQSSGQEAQSSSELHVPSGQRGVQGPQSTGQLTQFSIGTSHSVSPHSGGQGPQSAGQAPHVSPSPQLPSPQHSTQSPGQVSQVSPSLQTKSPHPQQKPASSHMQSSTPTAHWPPTEVRPQPPTVNAALATSSSAAAKAGQNVEGTAV
jgi:hypothetical protein